jgi:hypothetical protein
MTSLILFADGTSLWPVGTCNGSTTAWGEEASAAMLPAFDCADRREWGVELPK